MRIDLRSFDVIVAPIISEKATLLKSQGRYVFDVRMDATKPEIKKAVEEIFGVEVLKVNTLVRKGKMKAFRGKLAKRQDKKRAIVRLNDGETIDYENLSIMKKKEKETHGA